MSKHPLTEQMGLRVKQRASNSGWGYIVDADDLEKILSEATIVNGSIGDRGSLFYSGNIPQSKDDTHTARLVCLTPIKPKTTKEKILDIMKDFTRSESRVLCDIREIVEKEL